MKDLSEFVAEHHKAQQKLIELWDKFNASNDELIAGSSEYNAMMAAKQKCVSTRKEMEEAFKPYAEKAEERKRKYEHKTNKE